jgi:hypothetical protein
MRRGLRPAVHTAPHEESTMTREQMDKILDDAFAAVFGDKW